MFWTAEKLNSYLFGRTQIWLYKWFGMLFSEFQSIKIKKAAEAIAVKTMVVNNTAFFF